MDYMQAIVSLMAGNQVQYRPAGTASWDSLSEVSRGALGDIVRGVWDKTEFRLKPRTVKIGSREVEAPVWEPVTGDRVWFWNPEHGKPDSEIYTSLHSVGSAWWFSSENACAQTHAAITALLRGEP